MSLSSRKERTLYKDFEVSAKFSKMKLLRRLFLTSIFLVTLSNAWANRAPAVMDGVCPLVLEDLSLMLDEELSKEVSASLLKTCDQVTRCKFSANDEDFIILDRIDQTICRSN